MKDLLPDEVIQRIAAQYRLAVDEAVESFSDQSGDEDSITGALGHALKMNVKDALDVGDSSWSWTTTSRKLRGRGLNAPEKRLGIDAVVELEVWRAGALVGRKALPLQSKKKWRGRDAKLSEQATKIAALPGGGLVVDYREDGFFAAPAREVAEADGHRLRVAQDSFRGLGDWLGDEFLACFVGSRNSYYDPQRELMLVADDNGNIIAEYFSAERRVLTKVAKP